MRLATLLEMAPGVTFIALSSHKDQARFRFLRKQLHSTMRVSRTNFWNDWLGSVTLQSLPLSSAAPSGPLLSHLICAMA